MQEKNLKVVGPIILRKISASSYLYPIFALSLILFVSAARKQKNAKNNKIANQLNFYRLLI